MARNISKSVRVNGIEYRSLNEASLATGIARNTLRRHIELQGGYEISIEKDRKPPNYWTLQRVKEVAKTCSSRAEFWHKHKGAALRAQRQGWLGMLFEHMEFVKHDKGYWRIRENIEVAARECETRSEFIEKFPAAYDSAKENGWLDEVCQHMVVRKSSGEVAVRRFLMTYGINAERQKKFPNCRDKRPLPFDEFLPDFGILIEIQGQQHKLGWGQKQSSLDYISKHDRIKKKFAEEMGYRFIEIWDFREASITALLLGEIQAVIREKGLNIQLKPRELSEDDNRELMTLGQWTRDKVAELASLCSSPSEFQARFPYAYAKCHLTGWAKELFVHMTRQRVPTGHWTRESLHALANQCNTKREFQKRFQAAYLAASRLGVIDDICSHMQPLRVATWTLESISEIALSCNKFSEFKAKHPSAYSAARKNGWLDKVRVHMSPGQLPHGYWNNLDNIMAVAKQCRTRTEFRERYGSACNAAKKHGWLSLVCAHMQ